MTAATLIALCCTVALFATTTYFVMGSVPLLVLRHDNPLDSRFVRGFFDTYYRVAMVTAGATALSYAIAGRPAFASGAAALALLAVALRKTVIARMDSFRDLIRTGAAGAIPGFRRTHVAAILINLAQLVLIVWSLTTLKV